MMYVNTPKDTILCFDITLRNCLHLHKENYPWGFRGATVITNYQRD